MPPSDPDPTFAGAARGPAARRDIRPGHALLSPAEEVEPELRLTIQLVLAGRRWRARVDEELRRIGQSAARMETLATIARSPPGCSQVEIASRIGVEGATLTRMLDALEGDGLVERLADPADRRTKRIQLNAAGDAALAEILAAVRALRARFLAGIGPERIDAANGFLTMLLDRLDEGLADERPAGEGFPGETGPA